MNSKSFISDPAIPGAITNPDTLDAPAITLAWTNPVSGIVTSYKVHILDTHYTLFTQNSSRALTLISANLFSGEYYNISIVAIAGDLNAVGGRKESEAYFERIRTMIERKIYIMNYIGYRLCCVTFNC